MTNERSYEITLQQKIDLTHVFDIACDTPFDGMDCMETHMEALNKHIIEFLEEKLNLEPKEFAISIGDVKIRRSEGD